MSVGVEASRNRLGKKLTKWGAIILNMSMDSWSASAHVSFSYKNNTYSFRYPTNDTKHKPRNATEALSLLSWSICRLVDCDLRGILPFNKTAKEYLQLTGQTSDNNVGFEQQNTDETKHLQTLGLDATASNIEIERKYKQLMRLYHPDRIMDANDKIEYEKKAAEVNQAFTELKKIRGIL